MKCIIIIVWLVRCWTLPFLRACSIDLTILRSMIGCYQTYRVVLDQIQRSGARCDTVGPIGGSSPLAKGPRRSKGWAVSHGWIGTCSVTEELEAGGTDDVCEWWLITVDLFIRNAGPPGNS